MVAESVFKNEERPEPHLDLKASLSDWDAVQPAGHCSAFGTREYTATLANFTWSQNLKWKQVCQNTWATIHGVKVKPTKCERKVFSCSTLLIVVVHSDTHPLQWLLGEITGYWTVNFGESECVADWGSFTDKVRQRG